MVEQAVMKSDAGPLRNERGVSLVEVMIALVVLLLVFMGLMQSALLSIDHNLRNVLRDEAVRIADQRMNGRLMLDDKITFYDGLRIIPFSGAPTSLNNIATGKWTAPVVVTRYFRNLQKQYRVCWRITGLDTETIRIDVAVGWDHKKENALQQVGTGNADATAKAEYVHQISTLRRT
jgi:type II secretory pathway pseudopilin PulG